jgi:ubiquinone biosynthesis monooxygenase Coq6
MAAVDKLHKLYSTKFEPIVWARSAGLEVVNELDSLKAAIMITAGAEGRKSGVAAGWETMAGGVKVLGNVASVARTVGGSIGSIVSASAQTLVKRMAERAKA